MDYRVLCSLSSHVYKTSIRYHFKESNSTELQRAAIIYLDTLFGIRGYIYSSFQTLIQMFLAAVQLSQKLNIWKTKFSSVASLTLRTSSKSFQKKLTHSLTDEINRGFFIHCKTWRKNKV